MAKCKYCGQPAGLLSRSHKECDEKHDRGLKGMSDLMRRYFVGLVTAADLHQKIERNRLPYFLTDEEIAEAAINAIKAYGDYLRRPFGQDVLPRIKAFLGNVGVSYARLNEKGALDDLAQKLIQGYVVDFFAHGVPMSQINISTDSVTSILPLSQQKKTESYLNVLNKAVDKFMVNGTLSDSEQNQIESYTSALGLDINCLPSQYRSEALERIGQAMVLKDLQKGILPNIPLTVPVMLTKGESPLWIYDNVTLFHEKFTREYRGGNHGMSFRIMKGITYRTGSFKGKPVEKSTMEIIGIGQLVITNKHFFFHCSTATVKIPYSKLIGVTPYSDGLEVHKEEAKPKRTVFQGFDAWFVMNILNQVNNI